MLNIYIDESGSFVPVDARGSWSLSAALVMPTPDERKCKEALRKLKVKSGARYNEEIKLKNVSENDYLQFLTELSKTRCTLYSVATDAGAQTDDEIEVGKGHTLNFISRSDSCKVTIAQQAQETSFVHACDTLGGSGGAPIFSLNDFAILGLHHSGAQDGKWNIAKRLDLIVKKSKVLQSLTQ